MVHSRAARPTPTAIAATMGRLASKVAMAPLKPLSPLFFGSFFLTSADPSRLPGGTRQPSKRSVAVSEARMPIFFSQPITDMPGVLAGTTNDLMPPRPALLSTVAQTTTKPPSAVAAPSPAVQKILWPSSTHSLVSSSQVAVVSMAAASEPALGSVIAIAPQIGWPSPRNGERKRSFCSSVPAALTAEPPRAGVGMRR